MARLGKESRRYFGETKRLDPHLAMDFANRAAHQSAAGVAFPERLGAGSVTARSGSARLRPRCGCFRRLLVTLHGGCCRAPVALEVFPPPLGFVGLARSDILWLVRLVVATGA